MLFRSYIVILVVHLGFHLPSHPQPSSFASKAPAKSLAEHHQALAQELKSCPELAGHLSTRGIGGDTKNSSRQYKRLVQRGGFAMSLRLRLIYIGYVFIYIYMYVLICICVSQMNLFADAEVSRIKQRFYLCFFGVMPGKSRTPTTPLRRMGLLSACLT